MSCVDTDANIEALTELLALYPRTAWVDAFISDMNGVLRGKRYPRADFEKLFVSGMQLPLSTFTLDITGACLDPHGLGVSDGDPDVTLFPVASSLVPVEWTEQAGAQVLLSQHEAEREPTLDPREVALRLQRDLHAGGLFPHCAFELEFYLLAGSDGVPPQPPLVDGQVYRLDDVAEIAPLLDDISSAARVQNIPTSVTTSEYAAGQYEINLRHQSDAVLAADHAQMLKRIVQAQARRHGYRATFMAKPFLEETGSGMHVHMSLCDAQGVNLFEDRHDAGARRLGSAVAGVLGGLTDAMAVHAPNVNAFRRFVPRNFVPVNCSWAHNNRSVAVRIPHGPAAARRFEFRVPGADANPYLVLAVLLGGLRRGLRHDLTPPPPAGGNASVDVDPRLPLDLFAALERLQASSALREDLGEEFVRLFVESKRLETRRFHAAISAREYHWYL